MNIYVFYAKDGESFFTKAINEKHAWKLFLVDFKKLVPEANMIFLKDNYNVLNPKQLDGW